MKAFNKVVLSFIICFVFSSSIANASPPAYMRNDISMYISSDAVVEAVVTRSKRWSEGSVTLHLVAKYKVIDVFKGNVDKDEILIVTDTCLDKPVPEHMLGYPVVEDYCRGGIGLHLTGVDSQNGKPLMKPGDKLRWILFLRKDIRKGAPQQTWLEVSTTGFYGREGETRNDIPPDEREGFDRMRQKEKNILTDKTIVGYWNIVGEATGTNTIVHGYVEFSQDRRFHLKVTNKHQDGDVNQEEGKGVWELIGDQLTFLGDEGIRHKGNVQGDPSAFTMHDNAGWTLMFKRTSRRGSGFTYPEGPVEKKFKSK